MKSNITHDSAKKSPQLENPDKKIVPKEYISTHPLHDEALRML